MKNIRTYVAILLIMAITASAASCAVPATASDLMGGITSGNITGKPADAAFTESMAEFSIKLFKESIEAQENSLVSPLSVSLALAMAANGASGETLSQMESLLGGGIPLSDLNKYLYSYAKSLPSKSTAKLNIANSIWFRNDEDRLKVSSDFLQRNADYYNAAAFKSAFNSQTVKDINYWVDTNTAGMIDKIIDKIEPHHVMYLINAVMFDARWQSVYQKENIRKDTFTDISGTKSQVDFMHSEEFTYLDDGMATGFLKPYAGGGYSFAALLPNESVPIESYIESLTGAGFLEILKNAQADTVRVSMPKFEYEYNIEMSNALTALGIPDAFSQTSADFSKMAESSNGGLFIGEVLHKTFISVDELGTKAGAVTKISMSDGAAPPQELKIVKLDRPFIFAIIDNDTNLPIFIGTLMTV